MNRYLVIIEKANGNYSAYIPDVPGCVATGRTVEEAKANIAEALKMHLEGLAEDGLPVPEPKAESDYVTA
ncbi:type II toxin-antitoxin system HicB family antitoxin [Desulfallas sp. Bu1-1]|uniref:type II toxin-antitoxin system HicB family antitoxin n=1 Tax=Desulfallas sp. Bu1-1 TaxID=2787620 RepID=UPI00189F3908|nr:type II toxin-antitoxin system HicB family antitoxin [Desulfallas sp. Bu1-1]MBF7083237.1 type II toxin-antitoxin system HicB family antitoxin [Desulfallas sp. Bu1-1]